MLGHPHRRVTVSHSSESSEQQLLLCCPASRISTRRSPRALGTSNRLIIQTQGRGHMSTNPNESHLLVPCPHCKVVVRADRLAKHERLRCPMLHKTTAKSGHKVTQVIKVIINPEPIFATGPCPYCGRVISGDRMLAHRSQCRYYRDTPTGMPRPHHDSQRIIRCRCGKPAIPGDSACYEHKAN